jgi:lipopolysaccharide heptosyltransferase II
MNILIRLPNWLGDMVMSTTFVQAVKNHFPDATVDLIAKKGIDFLLDYFPEHGQRFIFSKEEYKGISGTRKFGKIIRNQKKYDLFFSLPDSFSAAIMGHAIAAKERVGFKKELRSVFLTHAYQKKKNIHRVEEYVDLLQQYIKKEIPVPPVKLSTAIVEKKKLLIININSEASSRRLPKAKAISVINAIREKIKEEIILVGSNKEKDFVDEVFEALNDKNNISNKAGKTSLPEMLALLNACSVMLTTDSGPAHIANALGVFTIVLFGAGNENNTAPYNTGNRNILRLGQLPCEPCVNNTCKLYGIPKCLEQLDETLISSAVLNALK